jgi:hypothetical protein
MDKAHPQTLLRACSTHGLSLRALAKFWEMHGKHLRDLVAKAMALFFAAC